MTAGLDKSTVARNGTTLGFNTGAGGDGGGVLADDCNLAAVAVEAGIGVCHAIRTQDNSVRSMDCDLSAIPNQPIGINCAELADPIALGDNRTANIARRIDNAAIYDCPLCQVIGSSLHGLVQGSRQFGIGSSRGNVRPGRRGSTAQGRRDASRAVGQLVR